MTRAFLAGLLLAGCATTPARELESGAVASPEPHATRAGVEVLRRGGNAVDAAVAIQFALAVTFPNAGNLGGGGFMLVSHEGRETAIDYRETAPAAAHRDLFLDGAGNVVPRLSLDTLKGAGVPGTVAGMVLAHRRFGSRPWAELVEPAIRLAEEGWIVDAWSARSFASETRHNAREYLKGGAGERLVQKELAATLRRIAERGNDGFYSGETADRIVQEMKVSGGLITHEDLAAYRAKERVPIEGRYRGWRVVSMPPPSSGGVALLQLLGMAERSGLRPLGFHSARHLHAVCEMEKRVFADRSEFLGDPDFVAVPAERLTSRSYLDRRLPSVPPSRTDPAAIRPGPEETTHFSVVDRRGNAVSNTTTLNGNYGCGIVIRGAGFLMNNEMDDFSAKPGVPNLFGATGGAANAVAPGKRMLSSMTPTFVYRDGALRFVVGTPGGTTIFTTVFQVLVNRLDFGMSLEEAVAAARFHHQWPPLRQDEDVVWFEKEPDAAPELRALGYDPRPRGRIGDVHAIEIEGDRPIPVSDPRGIGLAVTER